MKQEEIAVKGFLYCRRKLCGEEVALKEITRETGTPCYIYSRGALQSNARRFQEAFSTINHRVCFAVKANRSLAVLQAFAGQGLGFDLVSGGELAAVIRAGANPHHLIYSGVGKTKEEICLALRTGILQFNVESAEELAQIRVCARESGCVAPIALRVNPDVETGTHPYIRTGSSRHKFGIDFQEVFSLVREIRRWKEIRLQGLACHIGSQICQLAPFEEAFSRMARLFQDLKSQGIALQTVDLGGGLGVRYNRETPPPLARYASLVRRHFASCQALVLLEPGRYLLADAGVLVTRLLYRKETRGKHFYIVDAGMNDLIRPTLYQAWHEILPLQLNSKRPRLKADVVGPLCETGDFLARDRLLPEMKPGEELALLQAAAYGYAQSSNYNARLRPPEVMINGKTWQETRPRESEEDLFRGETLLP